jgi:hypothetical protein
MKNACGPEGTGGVFWWSDSRAAEIVLQEATVANLVRAYVGIKTHPQRAGCRLIGREPTEAERKDRFAVWQLLEGES